MDTGVIVFIVIGSVMFMAIGLFIGYILLKAAITRGVANGLLMYDRTKEWAASNNDNEDYETESVQDEVPQRGISESYFEE